MRQLLLFATLVFAATIALTPTPTSKGDIVDTILDRRRVQAGSPRRQRLGHALRRPSRLLAAAWAVMAGVVIGRVVGLLRRRS